MRQGGSDVRGLAQFRHFSNVQVSYSSDLSPAPPYLFTAVVKSENLGKRGSIKGVLAKDTDIKES